MDSIFVYPDGGHKKRWLPCTIVNDPAKEAIVRSFSNVPPAHYIVEIESFSLAAEKLQGKYQSLEFEAGGYQWNLVLYPNGNKSENVKDHISLYLAIANANSLSFGWEVYAVFRLFLLDQKKDKFLIGQDAMGTERRFHRLKPEWGFDQFIPLRAFNDASNGYIVKDKCVFGAEVFVKQRETRKGECLSMIKNISSLKYMWKIKNFSKLEQKAHRSQVFNTGDYKWKILLYPNGNNNGTGSHLSVYLELGDVSVITPGYQIFTELTLRVRSQVQGRQVDFTARIWFSSSIQSWGWPRFLALSDLHHASKGYLVDDVCIVEAEVTVLGISKAL